VDQRQLKQLKDGDSNVFDGDSQGITHGAI
jgi:hypothetical protein